jgi:RNA polymerase sigma-70 factor, ECF subfamily
MFADRLESLLPDLRAYAHVLCGNPALADDIVQNACLSAWQKQDQYDPDKGPLRAWLFRILRNDYYQQMRHAQVRRTEDQEDFVEKLVADCDLESRSNLSRMLQAIESLKIAQRDAFLLVVAAGFTYEEAGQVLGCAPGTVKSRVSRARDIALDRFHSERWTSDAPDLAQSPINHLHDALDRIQAISNAA